MGTKKHTRGPTAPANSLVESRPEQTIENCRQVLDFCRCGDETDIVGSTAEYGRYLVIGLVIEALEHAGAEANRLQNEVARKEVAHG